MIGRKARNLLFFAVAAFGLIVGTRLWNLFVIARVPAPQRSPSTSDAAKRLEADVRSLWGLGVRNYAHPLALSAAADHVRAQLKSSGYSVVEQEYSVDSPDAPAAKMANLLASLPATTADAPVLVIGAHYDSAPNTAGADDNASGVAALLELARRLRGHPRPFEIRFVAFSTEEPPFFGGKQMGSFVHASSLAVEKRPVRGMLSLEMLGYYNDAKGSQTYPFPLSLFYPDRGDFIGAVSDLHSRAFLKEFSSGFHPPKGTHIISAALPGWIGEIGLSDQRNYWARGWPAVMVTDTSFLRYAHYHQPTDTPDRLDYERMADVVDGLVLAVDGLDAGSLR